MPADILRSGPPPHCSRPTHWHSTRRKLILIAAALPLAFLATEGILRLLGAQPKSATVLTRYFRFNPTYGWEGVPDVECRLATPDFDVLISHDHHGLRRSELATPIEHDARFDGEVVWWVGDSQTWGWGVDDGNTFVDHLNRLGRLAGGGRAIHRNLGAAAFGPVQEYLLLRDYLARGWRPDRVVVLFTANDPDDVGMSDGRASRPYLERVGDGFELRNHPVSHWSFYGLQAWLRQHSLAYNAIDYWIVNARQKRREREQQEQRDQLEPELSAMAAPAAAGRMSPDPTPGTAARQERLLALRDAYARMQALCRQHAIWFAVAATNALDAQEVQWSCEAIGVPVLDVRSRLEAHLQSPAPEPVNFREGHFTAVGHRLIAEELDLQLKQIRGQESRER